MREIMVIAPGTRFDRRWVEDKGRTYRFVDSYPQVIQWDPNEIMDEVCTISLPKIYTATKRVYDHPSWAIPLVFYVDDRVYPTLPDGYVMPGSAMGDRLEFSVIDLDRPIA